MFLLKTNGQTTVTKGMTTFRKERHRDKSLWKVTPVLFFPNCMGDWDAPRETMCSGGRKIGLYK